MLKILSAISVAAALCACQKYVVTPTRNIQSDINTAISIIKDDLRNPATAQFRKFKTYQIANGQRAVCFEFNAENGFGGMVGFTSAHVTFIPDGGTFTQVDILAAHYCAAMESGEALI